MKPAAILLFVTLCAQAMLWAQPPASAPATQTGDPDKPRTTPSKDDAVQASIDRASTTEHEIRIGDATIRYRATAANMLMKDEAGKLKATVFFVAYEAERPRDAVPFDRPITYVFNGGPGAASVWLHLGTAGPQRIDLTPSGLPPAPPHRVVENPWGWLDATDLVFIDPVGTGFSRPAEGEKGEQFYGVREDISWVADFIRLYTTIYERWASPKFLAGESYGTTRAAGLSEYLLERYGIVLNGIMLISTVLDFATLMPGDGNDLPYVLFLPTYTATAAYHQRLGEDMRRDLGRTLTEVRSWAVNVYLPALAKGAAMKPQERRGIAEQLSRYTSLPVEFIERANLRIDPSVFQKQLLAEERKVVGRFDTRVTGYDSNPIASRPDYDPSYSLYLPVYSTAFNDYVRRVLRFESILPYEVLTDRVRPWKYGEAGHGYLHVADNLRSAMIQNPSMRILFANGLYDLATPFFATEYTVDHLELSPELRENIVLTYYDGGHMMYHHRPDLEKLHADVQTFIQSALPKRE
jgi:carboxypeptidase C (cathepsin A)